MQTNIECRLPINSDTTQNTDTYPPSNYKWVLSILAAFLAAFFLSISALIDFLSASLFNCASLMDAQVLQYL